MSMDAERVSIPEAVRRTGVAGDRIFHCEFKPSTTDGIIIRDPVLTPLGAYT